MPPKQIEIPVLPTTKMLLSHGRESLPELALLPAAIDVRGNVVDVGREPTCMYQSASIVLDVFIPPHQGYVPNSNSSPIPRLNQFRSHGSLLGYILLIMRHNYLGGDCVSRPWCRLCAAEQICYVRRAGEMQLQ